MDIKIKFQIKCAIVEKVKKIKTEKKKSQKRTWKLNWEESLEKNCYFSKYQERMQKNWEIHFKKKLIDFLMDVINLQKNGELQTLMQ